MPEKVQHRIINSEQCPRCGSLRTESLGRDDTTIETRVCLDCQAKDPDGERDYYDVYCCEIIEAVRWYDNDEQGTEHEIYDSHYLADVVALKLLHIAEELVKWESDPDHYGGDLADLAQEAAALVAKAKGETP
jgi:hypothetical protein